MLEIGIDGLDEFGHAIDGQSFELALIEFTEKALYDVGPRGTGGHEMELYAGVSRQPFAYGFVFVGRIVVEDDVDLKLRFDAAYDRLHELQELLMAMLGHAVMDDVTRRNVESGEKGRCAMALVVVCHGAGAAPFQWQPGLSTVQGLDLALLVEGENDGVVGRIEVHAHHVVELLDQAGSRESLKRRTLWGLSPNLLHVRQTST